MATPTNSYAGLWQSQYDRLDHDLHFKDGTLITSGCVVFGKVAFANAIKRKNPTVLFRNIDKHPEIAPGVPFYNYDGYVEVRGWPINSVHAVDRILRARSK